MLLNILVWFFYIVVALHWNKLKEMPHVDPKFGKVEANDGRDRCV